MLKKIAITLVAAGAIVASAASGTFKISIFQDSVVDGKQVKAGDYKVEMKDNNTAVLKHGKEVVELPAREETAPSKFDTTELQYTNNNDLQEIRVGGTNTKIVFSGANAATTGY